MGELVVMFVDIAFLGGAEILFSILRITISFEGRPALTGINGVEGRRATGWRKPIARRRHAADEPRGSPLGQVSR
jgi:hypothetical protein